MSFPKNFSEQIIIMVLGKTRKYLSGKQIHDYADKHHFCSKDTLPTKGAIYPALDRLNEQKMVKLNSTSKKRNFGEDLWELTDEGEKVYQNISKIYSIIDYVPDWFDINTHCYECTDNKADCFEEYKVDLENVLREEYDIDKEIANWEIANLFPSPKNIQEFIFWLIMLKESRRQLIKFEKQLSKFEIKID